MIYFNEYFECDKADEAFEHWYNKLTENAEANTSRDGNVVGEVINAITVIKDPTRCIMQKATASSSKTATASLKRYGRHCKLL